MNAEGFLAVIGDSLLYLAIRLGEFRKEPQRVQTPEPANAQEPTDFRRRTNEQHLLEKIRTAGKDGIAASKLTRFSRAMSNFQRKTAIQKLLCTGAIRQERVVTDGRPKVVFTANPV